MPRISGDDRAAAAFRAGGKGPSAPRNLSKEAAKLWRQIVDDRPPDFFRPGSEQMLERFCWAVIEARKIDGLIEPCDPLDLAYRRLLRHQIALSAMITTLATKLRLSVQADVDRRSRKIDERPAPAALDPLLGGAAVVRLTSRRPRRGPDDGQLD
jgi:hypothetical protein